jgi:hypothetical protein
VSLPLPSATWALHAWPTTPDALSAWPHLALLQPSPADGVS